MSAQSCGRLALAAIATLLSVVDPSPASGGGRGGGFAMTWHTIDCGGGTSEGSGVRIEGTIGQPDAAIASGGAFTLVGGFWSTRGADRVREDLDGDGDVDAADLATLLAAWGTSDSLADLDGSGVVDAPDLAMLLAAWTTE